MIELLEERTRRLYLAGTITRSEYARTLGRLRRVHAARNGITLLCVSAAMLLLFGHLFG